MLRKLPVISGLVVLLMVCALQAQAPDTLWTKYYGSDGSDYSACVRQTDDGGFIITGSVNPFEPDSCPDLYLLKTNPDGSQEWARTYGGSLWECGRSVSQTRDGGYIVVGETESYGGGEMEFPDIYLLKTDSEGIQVWYGTYGGPGMDMGYCVEQTTDGGYIISGELNNCADLFLLKTDSLGNSQWTGTYGTGCSVGYCVSQTGDGGYIIAGVDYSSSYFGGYLLKVDSLGNEQWSRHYDSEDAKMIYYIQQTLDDGFILTGSIGHSANFDIFLKKVTSEGNDEWTRHYAIGRWDRAFCVQQTSDGGYILAGANDQRINGYDDAYFMKTDAEGGMVWDITLGGSYDEIARSIQQTTDGGYIACGYIQYSNQRTEQDIWLIRIDSEGTLIDDHNLPGPVSFMLYKAYPNPFNARTSISYLLGKSSPVKIDIFNILGQPVATVFEGWQEPGNYQVSWDASDQTSGVYFYKVATAEGSEMQKVVLVK